MKAGSAGGAGQRGLMMADAPVPLGAEEGGRSRPH